MLSDFSTISPIWICYCNTKINMESIECNGLYEHKYNNFRKEKAIFVQPSFIMLCCLVPSIFPQKLKLIGAKLSKLG